MRASNFSSVLLIAATLPSCASLERRDAMVASEPGHAREDAPERSRPGEVETRILPAGFSLSLQQEPEDAPPVLAPPVPPAPEGNDESVVTREQQNAVTLVELEQLALQNNPTLQQAAALVQQASGEWLQAGLYPNPTVGYMASEVGQQDTWGMQGGFVAQNFVTANKLQLNRCVSAQDIERARWQFEAQRRRVLNEVRIRFYEALGAQQRVELVERLHGTAEQAVDIAEALLEAQQGSRPDLLQAQIQLDQVGIVVRTAQARAHAARRRLANVAGFPDLSGFALSGRLGEDAPVLDWDTVWQQLQAASPELQMARTQIARAQAQIRLEQVRPVPDVQLQASVQQDLSTDDTVFGSQIGVSLPVHNRNQGNIAAAVAELNRAMAENARLELELRDRLAEAYSRYEIALAQMERYRDEILPKAQESLDLITEAYQQGELDFLRVLTARLTWYESNLDYLAALIDLRTSAVAIEGLLLTGGLQAPSMEQAQPGNGIDAGSAGMRMGGQPNATEN